VSISLQSTVISHNLNYDQYWGCPKDLIELNYHSPNYKCKFSWWAKLKTKYTHTHTHKWRGEREVLTSWEYHSTQDLKQRTMNPHLLLPLALCAPLSNSLTTIRKKIKTFLRRSFKKKKKKEKEKEKPCISHLESLEAILPEPFWEPQQVCPWEKETKKQAPKV